MPDDDPFGVRIECRARRYFTRQDVRTTDGANRSTVFRSDGILTLTAPWTIYRRTELCVCVCNKRESTNNKNSRLTRTRISNRTNKANVIKYLNINYRVSRINSTRKYPRGVSIVGITSLRKRTSPVRFEQNNNSTFLADRKVPRNGFSVEFSRRWRPLGCYVL